MTEQEHTQEQQRVQIQQATMQRSEDDGTYLGQVVFGMEGHVSVYEITFFSKRGKEWDYSLHFAGETRNEEEMLQMDTMIEENDDLYDYLLDAAWDTMQK